MVDCTALVTPGFGEFLSCSLQLALGGSAIMALVMFCLFLYAIHLFRLPAQVLTPVALLFLFIFSGAGIMSPIGGITAFTTLMWIVVALVGAVIALFFWGLKK